MPETHGRRLDRSFGPVLAAAIACTLTAAASFTLFTYISPYLTDAAGLPSSWIGPLLLGFGVAGIGGLVVAAFTADRWPVASLVAMTAIQFILFEPVDLVKGNDKVRIAAEELLKALGDQLKTLKKFKSDW